MWNPFTDIEIYSYYLNEIPIEGKKYFSPFRNDGELPSLSFYSLNNNLYWTDFGGLELKNGVGVRDGIGFVVQAEPNIHTREDAEMFIFNVIIPNLGDFNKKHTTEIIVKKPKFEPIIRIKKYREWSNEEKEYWKIIRTSLLKERRVFSVSCFRFLVNSVLTDDLGSKPGCPSFLYVLDIESKKWKLYRPKDNKQKWKSSSLRGFIEGYEFLPAFRTKTGLITSSTKDSLTCLTYLEGISCLNPSSENNLTALFERAKDLNSRFDEIYVWLDADKTGRINTQKLCSNTGWKPVYLPTEYKFIGKKDQFDIANKSILELKKIWEYKNNYLSL